MTSNFRWLPQRLSGTPRAPNAVRRCGYRPSSPPKRRTTTCACLNVRAASTQPALRSSFARPWGSPLGVGFVPLGKLAPSLRHLQKAGAVLAVLSLLRQRDALRGMAAIHFGASHTRPFPHMALNA